MRSLLPNANYVHSDIDAFVVVEVSVFHPANVVPCCLLHVNFPILTSSVNHSNDHFGVAILVLQVALEIKSDYNLTGIVIPCISRPFSTTDCSS